MPFAYNLLLFLAWLLLRARRPFIGRILFLWGDCVCLSEIDLN